MPLEQAAATRKSFAELRAGLLIAAAAQRYRYANQMRTALFTLLAAISAPAFAASTSNSSGTACTLHEFKIGRAEAVRAGKEFLPALNKTAGKDRQPALSAAQLEAPESICTLIGKDCKGKERRILFLRYRESTGTPLGFLVLSKGEKGRYSLDMAGWDRVASNVLAERMRRLDCDWERVA
jgi:hypothetical protein